jgi:hypothetical protein
VELCVDCDYQSHVYRHKNEGEDIHAH